MLEEPLMPKTRDGADLPSVPSLEEIILSMEAGWGVELFR